MVLAHQQQEPHVPPEKILDVQKKQQVWMLLLLDQDQANQQEVVLEFFLQIFLDSLEDFLQEA